MPLDIVQAAGHACLEVRPHNDVFADRFYHRAACAPDAAGVKHELHTSRLIAWWPASAGLLGRRYGLHASPGNRSSNSSLFFSADLPGMHTLWLSAYAGARPCRAARGLRLCLCMEGRAAVRARRNPFAAVARRPGLPCSAARE